jgi:hypothetical protein
MFAIWRMQASNFLRISQREHSISTEIDCTALGGVMVGLVLGIVIQSVYAGPVPTEALVDEAARSIVARCRRYDRVVPSNFVD